MLIADSGKEGGAVEELWVVYWRRTGQGIAVENSKEDDVKEELKQVERAVDFPPVSYCSTQEMI